MKYLIHLLFLSFTITVIAQTTNKDVIYISPNQVLNFVSDFNNTSSGEFWNNGNVYVEGNWNNDGIVDFAIVDINSGLTSFIGESPQAITGSNFNYLYDVYFDNTGTSAFNLEGDISVANTCDFTSGIIDNKLSNGLFVFEQNADYVGASNDSHVTGAVIKIGNQTFNYPVGNGDYFRSVSISNPSSENETFIGEYFYEDTNSQYPVSNLDSNLELVDAAEYWVIEQSEGTSLVTITLTWSNETTPAEILEGEEESIHIARWDGTLQLWVDQGGIQDAGNQSVSALVENYGVFTLAKVKGTLNLAVDIDFPPFLTPNDDGYNDTWNVNASNSFEIININIFDRYGKLLKSMVSNSAGWNGTYNGKRLPSNDYWFVANYKDLSDNRVKQFKSHFALKH